MKRIRVKFEDIKSKEAVAFFRSDLNKLMFFIKPSEGNNFKGFFYSEGQLDFMGEVSQEFIKVAVDISNRNLDGEPIGYYLAIDRAAPDKLYQIA